MRDLFINRFNVSLRWSRILPVEVILSLSGLFELIEWSIADIFFPAHGQNYVGTQGDVWDAQKDMFVATCGAAVAMVLLAAAQRWVAARRAGVPEMGLAK
jgi:putative membrane protein